MKFIFFTITEYPGFSGSILEEELVKCGAKIYVNGTGVDLVVLLVEDPAVERCVGRVLHNADKY